MRKRILVFLSVVFVLSLSLFCFACSSPKEKAHVHEYADSYSCHDRTCTICGKVLKATDLHNFADNITCHDRECTVCHDIVKATGAHLLPEHEACEDTTCILCHQTVKATISHQYGKTTVVKTVTCTEDGISQKVCSVCGYVYTTVTHHTGHQFDSTGHCVNVGCSVTEEEYNHTSHTFADEYSCHDRLCEVCNHLEEKSTDHFVISTTDCYEGTCFLCGEKIIPTASHTFANTKTCIDRVCSSCGQTVLATTSHNIVNGVCSVCGFSCNEDDFTFKSVIGGYKITSYKGEDANIIIPSTYNGQNVVELGDRAFMSNKSIENVSIPKLLKRIGYKAFYGCEKLKAVNIPSYSSLVEIKDNAFENCFSLSYFYIPKAIKEIPFEMFKNCIKLREVVISEDVETIKGNAFYGCTSLESVAMPKYLKSIGYAAFRDCTSLVAVRFYNKSTITLIDTNTFYNCSNLVKINLPNTLQQIGQNAFFNCSSLIELTIPKTVVQIGNNAFASCVKIIHVKNLSNCYYNFENPNCEVLTSSAQVFTKKISYNSDGFVMINDNSKTYILGYFGSKENLDLTEDYNAVDGIYDYAFSNLLIKSIIIPQNVQKIGKCAFKNCKNLNSVDFANGCIADTIGEEAFSGCSMLLTLTVPENVNTIGDSAFFNCNKIVQLRNLSSVSMAGMIGEAEILNDAGSSFTSSIVFDGDITKLVNGDKVYLLDYSGNNSSLDLSNTNITDIYARVFENNEKLDTIVLPSSLKSIGEFAFKYCKNLKSIVIPSTVSEIGIYAFSDCVSLTDVDFGTNENLSALSIGIFENCSKLTDISIPKNVEFIELRAFYGCSALSNVAFDSQAVITLIDEYAFYNCENITEIHFPKSLEEIAGYAFYSCKRITEFTFGSGFDAEIISIGDYAFNGCLEITTLDFGKYNHLNYIGQYCFSTCGKPTALILPNHAITIKLNAFDNCTGVEEFFCTSEEIWVLLEDNDLTNGEFFMDNTTITNPKIKRFYYSETQPYNEKKQYWHYDNGGNIVIWEMN